MERRAPGWHGYADAKPSESIQRHEVPGLAVAVVFPMKPGVETLAIPVKQYKDYTPRQKGNRARELAKWLGEQRQEGLVLTGFFQVDTQVHAANLGMDLLEELPDTHVEAHYNTFRLYFGEDHIDFAQAVALEYYYFTINLGILRAGLRLRPKDRTLFVAMDRFPGESPDSAVPGQPLPATEGSKFIDFVRRRSSSGIHIEQENSKINLTINLGTLDWWKPRNATEWRTGKSHPHFTLPDWLAAAAIAESYSDEFVKSASFKKPEDGADALAGMSELYQAFKMYDLWSAVDVASHLRPAERLWTVPTDAREFILARAQR